MELDQTFPSFGRKWETDLSMKWRKFLDQSSFFLTEGAGSLQ